MTNHVPTTSGGTSGPFVARRGFDARGNLGTSFGAPDLPTNLQNPSGDGTVVQTEYFWDHASFIRWDGRVGHLPDPMTQEIVSGEQYAVRLDFAGHELGRIAVWDGNLDGPAKAALPAGNLFGVNQLKDVTDPVIAFAEFEGFVLEVTTGAAPQIAGTYVLNSSGAASGTLTNGLTVPDGQALLWLGDTRLGTQGWAVVTAPNFQFTHTGAAAVGKTPGNWRYLNVQSWLKKLSADPDQPTDTQPGDFQTTLELNAKELKVFANGAWQKLYSEVDIRAWIAALSLFEGTVKEEGSAAIGAVETHQLPDLARLSVEKSLDQVSHYWTWVGRPNYEVKAEHAVAGLTGGVPGVYQVVLPNGVDVVVRVVDATTAWAGFENLGTGLTSGDTITIPGNELGAGSSIATFVLTDVNAPGTPIIGHDLQGAVLNPGDWVQIANRGTVTAPDLRWVTVGGDLLAKSRGDNLYGLKAWVAGGWEVGSLVVHNKTIWRATQGVTGSDPAPGTPAQVGPPAVPAAPWAKVDLASGVRWVSTDADLPTSAPAGEIYFVLQSAQSQGSGALYYWDGGANAWQPLGGAGGNAMELNSGYPIVNVGVPIGTIQMWLVDNPPPGWLMLNGQSFSAGDYPELAAVLGKTQLPDFRGAFVRGAGLNGNGTWGDANRKVGSWQEDATRTPRAAAFTTNQEGNHTHTYKSGWGSTNGISNGTWHGGEIGWWGMTNTSSAAGGHAHTITGGGDPETRPKNFAVHYIIKAADVAQRVRI